MFLLIVLYLILGKKWFTDIRFVVICGLWFSNFFHIFFYIGWSLLFPQRTRKLQKFRVKKRIFYFLKNSVKLIHFIWRVFSLDFFKFSDLCACPLMPYLKYAFLYDTWVIYGGRKLSWKLGLIFDDKIQTKKYSYCLLFITLP